MILNSFEFKLTEQKIEKIRATISEVDKKKSDTSIKPILLKIELNSLNALLKSLVEERDFYLEINRNFKNKTPTREDTLKFPEKLVYSRIANDISQEEIANILGTDIEEVKRQEAYLNKNLDIISLFKINDYLKEKISNNLDDNISQVSWDKFPVKEMLRRGWLPPGDSDPISYIKELVIDIFGNGRYEIALHRKLSFNGSFPSEYSLFAWQIQVLKKAKEITKQSNIPQFSKDSSWLSQLVRISTDPKGPLKAQEFLLSKGIILIVEPHLPSTYLDGAAMLLPNSSTPVIALTLRHDRLDNFWFVLLHELGHVFLHLDDERIAIFDEDVGMTTDHIEIEADHFALTNLIPDEQWDVCMCRFYLNEDTLKEDAENFNIHPSIIAGRIRKENNNYQIFNEQIGLKQVRKLFWDNNYDFE